MNFVYGHLRDGRFVNNGLDLQIPDKMQEMIKSYSGKEIILGVRPEHFTNAPNDGHAPIKAVENSTEYLGNHALVYLTMGNNECIANLKLDGMGVEVDTSELYIDMNRAHFFDPTTEDRIRSQENV